MNYNYMEAMKEDIKNYINENEIEVNEDNREEIEERLNDDLWICDSVTGNASGSYTFNSYTSKEYVTDNMDLAREALTEFCTPAEEIADRFLNEDWEYLDVTIRCYLLGQAIGEALDEVM